MKRISQSLLKAQFLLKENIKIKNTIGATEFKNIIDACVKIAEESTINITPEVKSALDVIDSIYNKQIN